MVNGRITYNIPAATNGYHDTTRATFSCDDGLGPSDWSLRICETSGNWNGTNITCDPGEEMSKLLPPPNEVCEGYVFTRVCHSVHRGEACVAGWGVRVGVHAW